ncbi:DMT family transporter [Thermobifida halotolerans]|uniref:DMT family transporter n=1 Tax=Thermobifida halotolerans TaxID=483545 RepID=A0AA97LWT6_9ACTN|nr:DMT family transporter [Thermobifida halotolerans]UOE19423.1 DMT family transporter [Thermobifida halotolerans]
MTGAIIAAAIGAVAFAAGAALQERAILVAAPAVGGGQLRLLLRLARNPVWLAGSALSGVGLIAHAWALSQAPLTVVQPIGISGLLCAVVASAVLHRRRPTGTQVTGCLAVTLGLVVLVMVLSKHPEPPAEPPAHTTLVLPAATGTVMLLGLAVARFASGALRSWALALAGGISFAAVSALTRIIGIAAVDDPLTAIRPLTLVTLVIALCGALLVQNSYRTSHFALAYATMLISDPLMAMVIGVALLGETLPTGGFAVAAMALSGVSVVAGTVTLARSSAGHAPKTGKPRAALSPVSGGPRRSPRPADAGLGNGQPGRTYGAPDGTPRSWSVPDVGTGLGGQRYLGLGGPSVTLVGDGDGVSGPV